MSSCPGCGGDTNLWSQEPWRRFYLRLPSSPSSPGSAPWNRLDSSRPDSVRRPRPPAIGDDQRRPVSPTPAIDAIPPTDCMTMRPRLPRKHNRGAPLSPNRFQIHKRLDRQMIRGDAGERRIMRFHFGDDPLAVGDDAVERQKRQAGGETRDCGRQLSEGGLERVERRAVAEAPLVEVAEQDGRHLVAVLYQFHQSAGLLGSIVPQQAEMRGDDAQHAALLKFELGDEGAARLQPRQPDLMHVMHQPLLEQHDIAVPAMRLGHAGDRHRDQSRLPLQPAEVENAGALAEARIGLLQCDHVGADFMDHPAGALRVEAAVGADAFVHIIGSDQRSDAARPCLQLGRVEPLLPAPDRGENAGGKAVFFGVHRKSALVRLIKKALPGSIGGQAELAMSGDKKSFKDRATPTRAPSRAAAPERAGRAGPPASPALPISGFRRDARRSRRQSPRSALRDQPRNSA
ncbi:hypothetical protein RHECNPAF_1260019 [Rhizobium etli CNPAF512]|nr:hypothetical protein RHECNPAF_1260019 [Rhizobium etli CNPAF512]